MNADPDMNLPSFYPNGVPGEVVRHSVWLLVHEAMHIVKRRHGYFDDDLNGSGVDWFERQHLALRTTASRAGRSIVASI